MNQLLKVNDMKLAKLVCAGLVLFCCCDLSTQKTAHTRSNIESVKYSGRYLEPVYTDADRLTKIEAGLSEIETIYKEHAQKNHFPGFVYGLVVDDSLIFSGAVGTVNIASQQPVTVESRFHIASMTKSFTAMAILKLRDEGKLSLLDEVGQYIPELTDLKYLTRDA